MFEPAIGGGGIGIARALLSATTHSIATLTAEHLFSLYTQSVITSFPHVVAYLTNNAPTRLFSLVSHFSQT
ncbi:hypothetical protein [Photorhabdus laumondii]